MAPDPLKRAGAISMQGCSPKGGALHPKFSMERTFFRRDPYHLQFLSIWTLPFVVAVYLCTRIEAQSPDRDAMFAVRSELFKLDDSSTTLRWWNTSTSYCNWKGVTCDSEGVVTKIFLSNSGGGSISESVGRLEGLQVLHLDFCKLEGSIPRSIKNLGNLTILDLSSNNLSGTIPSLEGLSNLKHLSLSSNILEGPIPSLTGLANLTLLNLSANELSGEIPHLTSEHSHVEILNLSFNRLRGSIPVSIDNLRSLQELDLSYNWLEGTIPRMDDLTNLKVLYLQLNELEGTIPSLKKLANLTELSLAYNHLSGSIPELDWESSAIETIFLGGNRLGGRIPADIVRLRNLQTLDLSSNKLEGAIPDLERFENLTNVDLSDNELTGGIPGWDWNRGDLEKTFLHTLDLSKNLLSGSIPGALFFIVLDLGLSTNTFHAVDMNAHVNECSRGHPRYGLRSTLKYLDLSSNPFQSGVQYSFPGQFFGCVQFPELQELWLADSHLSGDISMYLFDLFKGGSSTAISAFPRLRVLQCAGNNLSGTLKLPSKRYDPMDGKMLQYLDLSRNPNLKLFDTTASNDSFLQNVLLGQLPFLTELRLSHMNSTGVLPSRIGYLKFLVVLDLSYNNLSGVLGDSYSSTLPELLLLDLSHNRLTGEVPRSLTKLSRLHDLNLSYNNFSGPLPRFLNPDDASSGVRFNASFFVGNDGLCGDPLPSCPTHLRRTHSWTMFVGVVCASVFGVLSSLVLVWKWTICVFSKRQPQDVDLVRVLQENATPMVPLKVLKRATENFSERFKIGQGGDVFYGTLDDGTQVAIRRLKRDETAKTVFLNEIKVLSQVNHRNLVKLLGCCRGSKIDALLFEYIPNGTLLQHLREKRQPLSWIDRLLIAVHTADALSYLHFSASPPIFHLDVKSANILLTHELHAKLADFGMSRMAPREGSLMTCPAGTPGYMDPEYFATCKPTNKSDVFSFGVVLLELISGQTVIDFGRSTENLGLVSFALQLISSGDLEKLVDPSMSDAADFSLQRGGVLQVAKLAERCLRESSKDRPNMKEVWKELHSIWASTSRDGGALIIRTSSHDCPISS